MPTLVEAVLALQIAAGGTPVGVAAATSDRAICVAMPAGAVQPGMALTLIQLNPRQSLLTAIVTRSSQSCEPLERAMIPGPYYLARRPSAEGPSPGTLWV